MKKIINVIQTRLLTEKNLFNWSRFFVSPYRLTAIDTRHCESFHPKLLLFKIDNEMKQSAIKYRSIIKQIAISRKNEISNDGINRKLLFVLAISFIVGFSSLHAQTQLQVYQDTAALNNPSIQSLYRQYEMVKQKAPQIGALPDLTFAAGYFISPVETRVGPQQATLGVSQSFPWFGQLEAQEKSVIEKANVVLELFNSERSKINFDVSTTYYNLYVLRAAIRITEDNIVLLNTMKNLANVKFESGKASMVDVLRIEMELGELENQIKYLRDSKRPLEAQFEQLLNTELTEEVSFPEVLWSDKLSIDREIITDSVQLANPSILSLQHQILSFDQEVIAANKIGAPSFTVGLNYTFVGDRAGYTGDDNGRDVILPTVGVKIPLYRKKYDALIKEKEIAKESVSLKKDNLSNELNTKLATGFRDYDDAVRRVELYLELSQYARQALDILMAEYTSTEINFEEVIRMDRKLLRYELELEKARANQNTTVAYINYLMGK